MPNVIEMPDVAEAIYYWITEDAACAAAHSGQVYQEVAPAEVSLPWIVVSVPSVTSDQVLSGPSGILTGQLQVDIYADDGVERKDMADAVRNALDGYRGRIKDVDFMSLRLNTQNQTWLQLDDGQDQGAFRELQTYTWWARAPVPTHYRA